MCYTFSVQAQKGGNMSKNVTIRLDEAIEKQCRHAAVEENKSLSQWIADQLAKAVTKRESISAVRERAIKRMERGFDLGGKPIPRDELHER